MTTVHEFWWLHVLVSLDKLCQSGLVECSHRLGQIPINPLIGKIDTFGLVILEHPGKNRILWKIRERSIARLVQMHQILIITYLLCLPHECYFLQGFQFYAVTRHPFRQDVKDIVTVLFGIEGEVVRFVSYYLQADVAELVPTLEEFTDFLDLDLVHWFCWDIVKWLEIHLLTRDKQIPIDMIQWKNSSSKYIRFLHHWFLTNTLDQTHIKCPLIELLDNHLIDFLLHIEIILLLDIINQESYPFLQIFNLLIRRPNLNNFLQILDNLERLGRPINRSLNHSNPWHHNLNPLLTYIYNLKAYYN